MATNLWDLIGTDPYGLATPEQQAQVRQGSLMDAGLAMLLASQSRRGQPRTTLGEGLARGLLTGRESYQTGLQNLATAAATQQKMQQQAQTMAAQQRAQSMLQGLASETDPARRTAMFQQAAPLLAQAGVPIGDIAKVFGVGEAQKPVVLGEGQMLVDPTTGKQIAAGAQPTTKPTAVSAGQSLVDPSTGKVIYTAPKDASADYSFEKLGADLYRVNKTTGESTKIASGPSAENIKVIDGVAYSIDPATNSARRLTVEGVPMGQQKEMEAKAKQESAFSVVESMTKNVQNTIKEAKGLVGQTTAGYGGLLKYLPQTDARQLGNRLDTIKANLGFDRLQLMRDMSPTGGALGQVAVRELDYLQASIANLDQMTTAADLTAQLDKIQTHYDNWLDVMKKAREQGGVPSAPSASGTPSSDVRSRADAILQGGR